MKFSFVFPRLLWEPDHFSLINHEHNRQNCNLYLWAWICSQCCPFSYLTGSL